MLLTKDRLTILTSPKKAAAFESECKSVFGANVSGGSLELEIIIKDKSDDYKANYATLIAAAKLGITGTMKLGTFTKAQSQGAFTTGWGVAIAEAADIELVDVSSGFACASAVKDDKELLSGKNAARLSAKVMKLLKEEITKTIDEGNPPTHAALSDKMDKILDNPIAALKLSNVNEEDFEACYPPTIQSGGEYNLALGAESDQRTLSGDVIIASLGARFEYYCAHLTRTYFINPSAHVQKVYQLLLDVQQQVFKQLRDGTALKDVYAAAEQYIKEDSPNLLPYFTKSCGHATGIGLRDSSHVVSAKNVRHAKKNMMFVITVGFHNVPMELTEEEKAKKADGARALKAFSCAVGDTVVVGMKHQDAESWTTKAKSDWGKVSFDITGSDEEDEDQDDDDDVDAVSKKESRSRGASGARRSSRIDHEAMNAQKAKREELERKQLAVLKKRQEKALRDARDRAAKGGDGGGENNGLSEEEKSIETFKSSDQYPRNATTTPPKIFVDVDHECIFFPINGMSVPFHISTLKNATVTDERKVSFLRVNFFSPNDKGARNSAAPAIQHALAEFANQVFVKELVYRSEDARAINDHARQIKQLQKEFKMSMRETEEKKNIVEQVSLKKWPNDGSMGNIHQLKDISMRPKLGRGRRTNGTLQMHKNGLRFRCDMTRDQVDIIFSNIKHLIFQKCDKGSHVVMIHVHLKHQILLNKKKTSDISFYTEAIEASTALSKNRRNMYDPDEMDEEQRERKMRRLLNKNLLKFCKKVHTHVEGMDKVTFDVEQPYADLSFNGAPHREMCRLQPTVDALVNVTETPPFVVTLADMEHVHFEGVLANKKNFDMAIVMKDKTKVHRIQAIPMNELGCVREWLTDIGQTCTHGSVGMQWDKLLGQVREIPEDVFWADVDEDGEKKDVGWDFLNAEARQESDAEGEEEGSEFEADESEEEEEESDWQDEVDSEDSDALDDEAYSDEGSDAGESWEEMDKKAANDDKRKRYDRDDDQSSRKRSRRR